MQLVKDKGFYLNILSIAIPLALQNLITFGINMADTLMLAKADYSGTLLSAANLANQPFFILSMFIFGFASAGSVLASQYWGRQNLDAVRRVISIVVKFCALFGAAFSAAVLLIPETIMSIYTDKPAVIESGAEYLRVMGYAYFFFSLSSSFLCSLRSVEIVRISVVVNLSSLIINIFLNWVLIFGNLGAPAMGIRGAAIATMIARMSEFLITIVFVFFVDKKLRFRFRDLLLFDKSLFRDFLRHGSPVVINEVMWSLGVSVQAIILGHISYGSGDPVAANSVASTVHQFATIFIFGIANSATVLIGKSIGEGKLERAKLQANTYRLIALIVGLIGCAVVMLLRKPIVGFFELEPQTVELALQFMVVIAINLIFVSFSATYIVGILRGAGDTKFCLFAEVFSLWGISTPLAAVLAVVLQVPVPLVLAGMRIDELIKSVMCVIRANGSKWIKSVTRDKLSS